MASGFQRMLSTEIDDLAHTADEELNGVKSVLKDKLQEWRREALNVAVIGRSGQGKSTLINAILNIAGDRERRAATGVIETTAEVKPYRSPHNDSVVFWDLPGVGTERFPRETYFKDVKLVNYDFFIIVTASRFTEDDIWLANEIIERGIKTFFFVWNKIDSDIKNDARNRRDHNQHTVLETIRKNLKENLGEDLYARASVFLVSGQKRGYEFENMTNTLLDKLPELKKASLAWSLENIAERVIQKKYENLHNNIGFVALESSRRKIYPLSGSNLKANLNILAFQIDFYRKIFGLSVLGQENARALVKQELTDTYLNKSFSKTLEKDFAVSRALLQDHLDCARNAAADALTSSVHDLESAMGDLSVSQRPL